MFPGLPTAESLGIKDFKPELWYGLMAPAANHARSGAARAHGPGQGAAGPRAADMMTKGVDPTSLSPEQFGQKIRADIALWGGIARAVSAPRRTEQ